MAPMRKTWSTVLAIVMFTMGWNAPARAEGLQCVPYARDVSGIDIHGDAHLWWQAAQGRYERGPRPRVGAVMVFRPHGSMRLGHVATVSRIVDDRTVLLDHANWSVINGQRGQIERDVVAVDASRRGDWSKVRVWYAPIGDLGTTRYPIYGFVYPGAAPAEDAFSRPERLARADVPVPPGPMPPGPVPPGPVPAQLSPESAAKSPDRQDPIADLLERIGQ